MRSKLFNQEGQVFQSFGVSEKTETNFSISAENAGIVIRSLTKNLYSSPTDGVLRELLSNAVDSVRQAGNKEIFINIPIDERYSANSYSNTSVSAKDKLFALIRRMGKKQDIVIKDEKYSFNPSTDFVIRDFGTGIEPSIFEELYTSLFTSTKREDDNAIGYFGLGSKSPFALSDTFVAINYVNGIRYHYIATLLETEAKLTKISEEETDEPNGLCVIIPNIPNRFQEQAVLKRVNLFSEYDFSLMFNGKDVSDKVEPLVLNQDKVVTELRPSNSSYAYLSNVYYELSAIKIGDQTVQQIFHELHRTSITDVTMFAQDLGIELELTKFIMYQYVFALNVNWLINCPEVEGVVLPPSRDTISLTLKDGVRPTFFLFSKIIENNLNVFLGYQKVLNSIYDFDIPELLKACNESIGRDDVDITDIYKLFGLYQMSYVGGKFKGTYLGNIIPTIVKTKFDYQINNMRRDYFGVTDPKDPSQYSSLVKWSNQAYHDLFKGNTGILSQINVKTNNVYLLKYDEAQDKIFSVVRSAEDFDKEDLALYPVSPSTLKRVADSNKLSHYKEDVQDKFKSGAIILFYVNSEVTYGESYKTFMETNHINVLKALSAEEDPKVKEDLKFLFKGNALVANTAYVNIAASNIVITVGNLFTKELIDRLDLPTISVKQIFDAPTTATKAAMPSNIEFSLVTKKGYTTNLVGSVSLGFEKRNHVEMGTDWDFVTQQNITYPSELSEVMSDCRTIIGSAEQVVIISAATKEESRFKANYVDGVSIDSYLIDKTAKDFDKMFLNYHAILQDMLNKDSVDKIIESFYRRNASSILVSHIKSFRAFKESDLRDRIFGKDSSATTSEIYKPLYCYASPFSFSMESKDKDYRISRIYKGSLDFYPISFPQLKTSFKLAQTTRRYFVHKNYVRSKEFMLLMKHITCYGLFKYLDYVIPNMKIDVQYVNKLLKTIDPYLGTDRQKEKEEELVSTLTSYFKEVSPVGDERFLKRSLNSLNNIYSKFEDYVHES